MAVNGIVGANYLLTRIGNSYKDEDCIHAVVINLIRNCAGGDTGYRTAGCTELWNSFTKYEPGNKYRHIVDCKTIAQAKEDGLMIGDLPVIYNKNTGKCEHIAYYMGGIGGYECIHSSATKKCVCGTTLKNGFTHVLRHRDIISMPLVSAKNSANQENTPDIAVTKKRNEDINMNILYYAKVATNGGALNLRSSRNKTDNVLCEIPFGTELPVYEATTDGWSQVCYNGSYGYVSSAYLMKSTNSSDVSAADHGDNEAAIKQHTGLGGTWGVFIPCSNKIAANMFVGHFANAEVIKVSLGD